MDGHEVDPGPGPVPVCSGHRTLITLLVAWRPGRPRRTLPALSVPRNVLLFACLLRAGRAGRGISGVARRGGGPMRVRPRPSAAPGPRAPGLGLGLDPLLCRLVCVMQSESCVGEGKSRFARFPSHQAVGCGWPGQGWAGLLPSGCVSKMARAERCDERCKCDVPATACTCTCLHLHLHHVSKSLHALMEFPNHAHPNGVHTAFTCLFTSSVVLSLSTHATSREAGTSLPTWGLPSFSSNVPPDYASPDMVAHGGFEGVSAV